MEDRIETLYYTDFEFKDAIETNQNLYNCNKGQNNKFGRSGTKENFAKNTASLTSACAGGERDEGGIKRPLTRTWEPHVYTRRPMWKSAW